MKKRELPLLSDPIEAFREHFPNVSELLTPEFLAALDREREEWARQCPRQRVFVGYVRIPNAE